MANRPVEAGELQPEPDTQRYAEELRATLRQRSPDAYRQFLLRWRDLHERGVAERLAAMGDASLRLRIERMILDIPALSELHAGAREYVQQNEVVTPPSAPPPPASAFRLRRRRAPNTRGGAQ